MIPTALLGGIASLLSHLGGIRQSVARRQPGGGLWTAARPHQQRGQYTVIGVQESRQMVSTALENKEMLC
jgi:hypothetical protein